MIVKGNMTEFQVIHHFKHLEMQISLIYWTCDFKVLYAAVIELLIIL